MSGPFGFAPSPFVGAWPPTDPRDLSAMWHSLLDDWDALGGDYLGETGAGTPMFDAWEECHRAMLALEPETVEAATAIVLAVERDAREAEMLDGWDEGKVQRARALAWPHLIRSAEQYLSPRE